MKEFRGKRKTKSATRFGSISKSPLLTAVEIVSGYDIRTALGVLAGGTVRGIVAAPYASTRATGLDELDIMVITQADTALGVSMTIHTSTGVVLASRIVGIQAVNSLRTDTTGDCKSENGNQPSRRGRMWWRERKSEYNSRWMKRPPLTPFPVTNATSLQKSAGSRPC